MEHSRYQFRTVLARDDQRIEVPFEWKIPLVEAMLHVAHSQHLYPELQVTLERQIRAGVWQSIPDHVVGAVRALHAEGEVEIPQALQEILDQGGRNQVI